MFDRSASMQAIFISGWSEVACGKWLVLFTSRKTGACPCVHIFLSAFQEESNPLIPSPSQSFPGGQVDA